jgi:adenylyl-sulfate kinase
VHHLFDKGQQVVLLDGDTLRQGLCADLGFSDGERSENIRRAAHAARLFFEQGTTVVCTFISPCQKDRTFARSLIAPGRFVEVFVKCDLEVCKQRDPKGLYRQALAGELEEFTGVSSPYEPPQAPEVVVESDRLTPQQCVERICHFAPAC